MTPSESEDGWERRLRQQYQPAPDHGFTERVLAALPAPSREPRLPILAGMSLASGILGLFLLPGRPFLNLVASQLAGATAIDMATCFWLLGSAALAWAIAIAIACEHSPEPVTAS